MIQQPLIEFFRKFRLPLHRGNEDIYTFLSKHFKDFEKELDKLLDKDVTDNTFDNQIYCELREKRMAIGSLSQTILNTLNIYQNGNILEAHQIFASKMNEMQDHIAFLNLKGFRLFRIRQDSKRTKYQRKELFHVPFEKVNLIRAGRYSIPGFPCLYLGGSAYSDTGVSLCWFECNLPDKFYWSEFEITDSVPALFVIDFVYSPFESALRAAQYRSHTDTGIINFIVTYCLMAACSLIATDKGDNRFIPEYIIPQMLLLWARNNSKCDGVAYPSSSKFDIARNHIAFNVALPTKQVKKKGYCPKLKKEFRLSEPRFVDIASDVFKPLDRKFINIRNCIHEKYQILGLDPLREMVSVCDSFFLLHSTVLNGKYQDMFMIYDYIKNLNLFAENLLKFKEYYRLASIEQVEKEELGNDAIVLYNDAWEKFIEFRDVLRNYWDFIDKQLKMPEMPVFKFI